jgi:hypothetical protein
MIKRADSENIVTDGLSNAQTFWTGISTVPTVRNSYNEDMYTGTFDVIDTVNDPMFDGYCFLQMMQAESLQGSSNYHYLSLRETGYQLPIFRAEDSKVYMPISVVFGWNGDTDSYITLDTFDSSTPNSLYIKTIFTDMKASVFINGVEKISPDVSACFSSVDNTRKLLYRILTQNVTGYSSGSSLIQGTIQVSLTDTTTQKIYVLHQGSYTVDPSRTYQFETRISHS